MIKKPFSQLLVIVLVGFVPLFVWAQAVPSATAENKGDKARKAALARPP